MLLSNPAESSNLCLNPKWLASSFSSVLAQLNGVVEQSQAPVSLIPHLYLEVSSP